MWKTFAKLLESYFYAWLILAVIIALIYPTPFLGWKNSISYFLGIVMFVNFLKIDVRDLVGNLKKPGLMLWLLGAQMLLVPTLLYVIALPFNHEVAVAFLLIAALPPGVASAALVDLFKGNVSLALVLTMLGHVVVPFTIPLLLWVLLGNSVMLPLLDIFKMLLMVIMIPLVLAYLTRRYANKIISPLKPYFPLLVVGSLFMVVLVAVSLNASYVRSNVIGLLGYFMVFVGLSLSFHALGWLMTWKQSGATKIAAVVTLNYNNIALGILLAVQFFSPTVVLYTTIYEIIWNLLLPVSKTVFKLTKRPAAVEQIIPK
ncbi:MAG: bile acid:sodium symporter [Patescibacteria group bacterium]|jgi:BASS family bile acid:Na+ symporter